VPDTFRPMGGLPVFGAIDIGASSGRVIAGVVTSNSIELHEVHRFANGVSRVDGHLRWDIEGLFDEVLVGLNELAGRYPTVASVGIDMWAIDYGLLDHAGNLLAPPIAYRDDRTADVIDSVHERMSAADLYRLNGLQHLPFTTVYQLAAEQRGELWQRAAHVVLLPDLIAFWLTGTLRTEYTNASTTGLVDVRRRTWSSDIMTTLGLSPSRFAPLEAPGSVRGRVRPELAAQLGLTERTVVTTVGSHDTASAVAGVPATQDNFAYIASGTWSLVGLETPSPIITDASRVANFTNEAGLDGTTRFLRNVGGLWLLQECLRTWNEERIPVDLPSVLAAAATLPNGGPTISVDDPEFIPPGDMPSRISAAASRAGQELTSDPVSITRCVIDSLAKAYAATIATAAHLAGRVGDTVDIVHIVGGGSNNELLCQLTANRTGCPVVAGPVEATALGNVITQARAHGVLPDTLAATRQIIAEQIATRTYHPRPPHEEPNT
jgi:rhamnulokinase